IVGCSGVACGTAALSGGVEIVDGVASGTTVMSGGQMVVSSGGQEIGTTVESGGTLTVMSGGIDSVIGTTILAGGTEIIMGSADVARLDSGASLIVASGGGADGPTHTPTNPLTVAT